MNNNSQKNISANKSSTSLKGVQSLVFKSSENLSPEKVTSASMASFANFPQGGKLKPVYPKIVEDVTPLMYDSSYGNVNPTSGYKFQDKGMPLLINYRALQNQKMNQQIPVNILVSYFKQWIEIMKLQIDDIVNNLYDNATLYKEKSILNFKDALAYNQKYMKYIMLSIIPSREIHQNQNLIKVDQTLSRQNLKLTTCQHCYDFTVECEDYAEKVLTTEKIQSEQGQTVKTEIQDIKAKYKQLITDVECKQIFSKYTHIFQEKFLEEFALQATNSKKTFNDYHEFRRQVGKYITIDIMNTELYDQEDAIKVFSVHLPKADQIIKDLSSVQDDYYLMSMKIKQQAFTFRENITQIQNTLMDQIQFVPQLMLEQIENLFSAKFCLNMNLQKVEILMEDQFKDNEHFLKTISQNLTVFKEQFDKYLSKEQQFHKKWTELISFYKQEVGPFVDKLKQNNSEQQLFIDIDSAKLFSDLKARGKKIEEKYISLWKFLGELRKDLNMRVDIFEDDKEVISRELEFLEKISKISQSFRQELYGSHFILDNPISLKDANGLETQKQHVTNFLQEVQKIQQEFDLLRNNNLLSAIFKKLSVKDPLMLALLDKQLTHTLVQIIKHPSLEAVKDKVELYNRVEQQIDQVQVKESTPEQLKDRLNKLIRNLIYCELKLTFKYEMIPQMKERLQKSITDVLNSDEQADQNEYYTKTVTVSFDQMTVLKQNLDKFNFPDFQSLYQEHEHIKNTYQVYNDIIGKQNVHIKLQTYKDVLDKVYKYFFYLQNPPIYIVMKTVQNFTEDLKENIKTIEDYSKKNLKDFEILSKILANQKNILQNILTEFNSFDNQLQKWMILSPYDLQKLISPLKNWLIHVHQKVFTVESRKMKNQMIYMNVCEEKEAIDSVYDKILRNKYFGLKAGMTKTEQDKLKQNFTPYKQEKYQLSLEWDQQKPKQTKLLLDFAIPFKTFHCKIEAVNAQNQRLAVFDKEIQNDHVQKTHRDEVEFEMYDLYTTVMIEVNANDEKGSQRVNYKREVVVSNLERETKVVLTELGVVFKNNEDWKIYVKNHENIMWNPLIKCFEIKGQNDATSLEFIQDVDKKIKSWSNVELTENSSVSYEFTLTHSNNANKCVFYVMIECDGCEKDLQTQDHKVFVNGKTPHLSQVFTYTMADSQCIFLTFLPLIKNINLFQKKAMRKDKPIWMLGYIKDNIFFKLNTFVSRSEVDQLLSTAYKSYQLE